MMNPRFARLLIRLYPRPWRERYKDEFEELLRVESSWFRTAANVGWSAFCEHVFPTQGGEMEQYSGSFGAMVRRPSAFLPMAMSLTALTVLGVAAIYGITHTGHGLVHEADEGTAAHLFQILIGGQLPILVFFAVKWLPKAPKQTLYVLVLQAGAVLAAMAPVYLLGL